MKTAEIVSLQRQVEDQRYVSTQLGMATLTSALSPDEALVVFAEVQKARKCFVLESELHIIYQVSLTTFFLSGLSVNGSKDLSD